MFDKDGRLYWGEENEARFREVYEAYSPEEAIRILNMSIVHETEAIPLREMLINGFKEEIKKGNKVEHYKKRLVHQENSLKFEKDRLAFRKVLRQEAQERCLKLATEEEE